MFLDIGYSSLPSNMNSLIPLLATIFSCAAMSMEAAASVEMSSHRFILFTAVAFNNYMKLLCTSLVSIWFSSEIH